MIFKIAEPPSGGKGLLGIYPDWEGSGIEEASILRTARERYCALLFTRNYFFQFFQRIAPQLEQYGSLVDIVCGWDVEKICMFYAAYNPQIEVFPISAMHFNTFDLLQDVRNQAQSQPQKTSDVFFALSDRPDRLKNKALLVDLLSGNRCPLIVTGYGRLDDADLARITANPSIQLNWREKAQVTDQEQRLTFLQNLARSRCLLVTSTMEGYARLIGEALYLGVPILLNAGICCENWVHLNKDNCLLFTADTFDACLARMLSREWHFTAPVFPDGNTLLQEYFTSYLARQNLPAPTIWYPLGFGARNDYVVTEESL